LKAAELITNELIADIKNSTPQDHPEAKAYK